jgi:outer membrane lipoprotein-sorting protein
VLFDPPQLLSVFRFAPQGRATRAERPVIVAEAHPRTEPPRVFGRYARVRHGLGTGADSYRLEVDTERGIILASHAFFQGEPFQVIEAQEITLDAPLDKALFEFQPPEDNT